MTTDTNESEDTRTEEQIAADAEADFAKGFESVNGDSTSDDETSSEDAEALAQKKTDEETEATTKAEEEATATPDPMEALETKVDARLRSIDGKIGGVMSKLEGVMTTAKAAVDTETDTPTDEQIAEAAQSTEKLDQLKEEFEEWADAMDEMELRVAAKIPKPVDVDGIKQDVMTSTRETIDASQEELREVVRMDAAHPNWEEDIVTPEFRAFSLEGGPSEELYAKQEQLAKTAPAQADAMVNAWVREFPEWWVDKGSKMFSPKAKDSIALLTSYKEQKKAGAVSEEDKAAAEAVRLKKQKRLDGATTPDGAGAEHTAGISDQAAFKRGFKKVNERHL